MTALEPVIALKAGTPILVGGNHQVFVTTALADAFRPGDALAVVESNGNAEVLHVPASERVVAERAVSRAVQAFGMMSAVSDRQISTFFTLFAENLSNDAIWDQIIRVNEADVQAAKSRGRSTTRLEASAKLRHNMIEGLLTWAKAPTRRGQVLETVEHETWTAQLVAAELGVVAFVFEGRPNVVADATGVLRGGNTVVFRIGRDALGTAKAMLQYALEPALENAGLPSGAVSLVDSPSHAAGWAMFMDRRLSLAVARGSGSAVHTLGTLAQSAGVPVSLHGTGGAWVVASEEADPAAFEQVVFNSLDRKVCNTVNTCCIPESAAELLVPRLLRGLERAAERRLHAYKLHVAVGSERWVPRELFARQVSIGRAEGLVSEMQAESIDATKLGHEWEWEDSPEVTLVVVDHVDHAIDLFNAQSPQFVASLVSPNAVEHEHFYSRVNAPFVGDALTRWVDGQFALKRPELGLSNWERGRLFGRGGILSGDSVYTVRTRYRSKA
jgi:glutamate-5-semialdehyde dehydrogenase